MSLRRMLLRRMQLFFIKIPFLGEAHGFRFRDNGPQVRVPQHGPLFLGPCWGSSRHWVMPRVGTNVSYPARGNSECS
ncbi:hypothetical protein B0T17DRAFT_516996 [Bombardia bombarda]|uniref:Uncharacterized protein n=1 Tax=Bombardia bombarda TaxID=252184 RepID=A0AA39XKJ7_9PEZI|nr:hypothetical protein B0T17DRAFT_516996 [Bombardia bombarda]